ncbi:MAG: phosphoglucosamine mutase [Longimicrobiales bacterium]
MSLQIPTDLILSVSGARGRVGEVVTPELVAGLAARFGAFLHHGASASGAGSRGPARSGGPASGTVLIGRDSRTSGPMLARAAAAGLQSVGCDVVDLGIVPTPTLLLAVEDAGAAGGMGVTASHNPAEWNALKFAGAEGMFLDQERMIAFQATLRDEDPARASWDALGGYRRDEGAVRRHLERILELPVVDVAGLRERAFHVALDCVRGAGGTIMPTLLESLGCRVSAIGTETDGRFPRDPEPTAAHLQDLGALVRESGADIGMAVDPDVDRLALVDEKGEPVGEDLTLALAAAVVLRRTPGSVVTNLSTSQVVEDVVEASGGTLLRAPVGEINVARRMQAEGAVVGGEGNGGVILPSLHHTRDAPVGAALLLQHLLDEGESLSALVTRWPSYHIVKEKTPFPREALEGAYDALAEDLDAPERDTTDGLRLSWPDTRRWLHVRPSGTEPVVRLIAEASDSGAARSLIDRGAAILEGTR